MWCSAAFSEDRKYRYQLIREWQPALQRLGWMMLNPSRADENRDDLTVKKVIKFSMLWGFGGAEIYNMFGLVAPYPQALFGTHVRDKIIGPDNDRFIKTIPFPMHIVLAYGVLPEIFWQREKQVVEMLGDRALWCLGLTGRGFPRHPSRIGYKTRRELFTARPREEN